MTNPLIRAYRGSYTFLLTAIVFVASPVVGLIMGVGALALAIYRHGRRARQREYRRALNDILRRDLENRIAHATGQRSW